MYKNVIKRLIDFILSSIAIIVLALPMLIISIVIKIEKRRDYIFYDLEVSQHEGIHTARYPYTSS